MRPIFFGSSFDTSVIWSLEYKLGLVGPTMPGYDIVCDLYLFIYCCTWKWTYENFMFQRMYLAKTYNYC